MSDTASPETAEPDHIAVKRGRMERIRLDRIAISKIFPVIRSPRSKAKKVPLKVGIHRDLIAALREMESEITTPRALAAIRDYCWGPRYSRAVAAGGPRYDLAGQPGGEVTAQQRAHAATALRKIESAWARRNASKAQRESGESATQAAL